MKKSITLLAAAVLTGGAACLTPAASAQEPQALAPTNFGSNWSIGIDGGVATPLKHAAFFGDMRPVIGLHLQKQISPTFGLGVEGTWGINTSSWPGYIKSSTAFDTQYLGVYGTANLMNLFGGYRCGGRVFEIEAVAGAGWGHNFVDDHHGEDWNYFATKAGLNFNFNVSPTVAIQVKPAVSWDMSDADVHQSSAAYNVSRAAFSITAGVNIRLGDGFECVTPYDAAQVNALNAQVNEARAAEAAARADADAAQARAAALATQLAECQNKAPQVITNTTTDLQSVRFVFFKIGSHVVTPDQMPNVVMIADYMKNNPGSKVIIKGYASQDGNLDFNLKLAANRAEAVKNLLIKKYGISADRIQAEGEGIGHMFKEESWNRVSICTLEDK